MAINELLNTTAMRYQTKITGLGKYVPENVVTNNDLAQIMDTSDEWIQERTGIRERRHIKDKAEGETPTAQMGVKAAKEAIARAKVNKDDIDLIILATLSPDYYFPGSGVLIQNLLEIKNCPALDVRNQCSGFVYGLSIADQFIKTGMYKNILLIGSEYHSGGLDYTNRGRSVSVLFGDGAGAAVLSRCEKENTGILSTHLHAQGEHALELSVKEPSINHWVPEFLGNKNPEDQDFVPYYPYMNGQFVFKHAIKRFTEVINEGLAKNNLTNKDIDLLIPHQANLRIAQFIQKQFKLSGDQVFNNIQKYGNTTAASIPIALTEAWEDNRVKKGDHIVLAAFGSGFTWASAVIHWT